MIMTVPYGNVICDGEKIFKMRHQMACAILGICKTHISREILKQEGNITHKCIAMYTHSSLFFQEKRATLLVMHAHKVGHLKMFYKIVVCGK